MSSLNIIGGFLLLVIAGVLTLAAWKLLIDLLGFVIENIKTILIIIAVIIIICIIATIWSSQIKR